MNRFILLAVLFALIAVVSSLNAEKNDANHKELVDTKVARVKRNMHRNLHKKTRLDAANLAARKKRNKLDDHALRAEADSLAAAAESVAAGDNAAEAAIEIEEERETLDHDHNQSDNKEGYEGSYGDNELSEGNQQDNENDDVVLKEESIHEKTKSTHKHTGSSESEEDSNSEGVSSEEGEDTSISGSNDNENEATLNKLMTQSSELAKQIRMVFDIMAKRETFLVEEMKKLQTSLTDAINVLKADGSMSNDGTVLRKRREYSAEEPYRACVYIESASENTGHGHGHHRVKRNIDETYPVQENIKYHSEALVKHNADQEHAQHLSSDSGISENKMNNGIDLSSVYWFKLPDEHNLEQVHEKIHKILTGIRASDRDILIIPVTKSFSSKQQVTDTFLNIFRTKRAAKQ